MQYEVWLLSQHNHNDADAVAVTSAQLLEILRTNAPFRQLLTRGVFSGRAANTSVDDEEDDDGEARNGRFGSRRRRKPQNCENKYPRIPSDEGRELMRSGIYGSRDHFGDISRKRKRNISERLMWRRLGDDARGSYRRANRLISQVYWPRTIIFQEAR